MAKFKIVMGLKDGKTVQKELEGEQAEHLLKKRIGESVTGDGMGFSGYEFLITGGSDKCGFPMRKGIQEPRKRVLIGEGVGFSGKRRAFGKKKVIKNQNGLVRRRTVCGEKVTKIIHQVNLKVTKEGSAPLSEAPAAEPEQPSEE